MSNKGESGRELIPVWHEEAVKVTRLIEVAMSVPINRVYMPGGIGVSVRRARDEYGVESVGAILIRDDGWVLACQRELLLEAEELWRGNWNHVLQMYPGRLL